MTMPNPPAVTTWQVTGTMESRQFAPDGTPVDGYTVYYRTGAGHDGTVFIPRAQWSAEAARQAIAPAAALLDKVNSLSSDGT